MKTNIIAAFCFIVATAGVAQTAEDKAKMPEMPKPQKEHEWLKQLEGQWDSEAEMIMEPGKPPMKSKGSETVKSIGGFWTVAENKGDMMGMPFTGVMTLGYSPEKKKYVGTWVDSAQSAMWVYEGTLDASGKVLTLSSEGPCPMQGGKIVKVEETLEIKSPEHKVFSSKMEIDGKLTPMMTVNYTKKK